MTHCMEMGSTLSKKEEEIEMPAAAQRRAGKGHQCRSLDSQ